MKNYINYHSHSSLSNISTPDSTISNKDRTLRAIELGQSVVSYVEHGSAISFLEGIPLSQQHGVKPLVGSEVYFVKDRFEKDNTNAHLILLAKNENGRKAINRIISEANVSGFYYRARVDLSLIHSLPKNDVWVTTACIGGVWKYDDHDDLVLKLFEYFGKSNFFLEVQAHHVDDQRTLNKHILDLSNRYGISVMAGLDSHMIHPEQAKLRDDYLLSRGISYPGEENWFLDFCDYDTLYQRFLMQGVLNKHQIDDAIENTNILQDVEIYNSPIFDKNLIKLPSLYPDLSQEQKDQKLSDLIWSQWNQEKASVPQTEWAHYEEEIRKEFDVIVRTQTSDYFLLDYEVVKRGRELGGSITLTGRGSAPSYYTSKLLGLTTVDRIGASVKLFPERFISAERLLEAKSLPDIDLNLGTPKIFAQAQAEVMGEGHSYPMIAFGTLKAAGAWKLYARTEEVPFDVANLVSDQIKQYELDEKHSEDDDDDIDVHEYVDPHYHEIYDQSKKYLGLINSITVHPCAYVLYSGGDIREEFGLIKTKIGSSEHICACCEGHFAEDYKLLKNDLLKVAVVDLIYRVYQRIGIKPHTLPELIKLCENDAKVWAIYKNAWSVGINQVERTGTSGRAAKYAPTNISEISAFVAAIRPGFKSNYRQFETREPFSYGVPTLDNLIQTEEFPYSYMLYQENAMQVLAFAGIPVSETYEIIKNIAKKRAEKVLKYRDEFLRGMKRRLMDAEGLSQDRAEEIADMTWQIIEDSSRYSFNACIAGSIKIQRAGEKVNGFHPTIEEMYLIKNSHEYAKATGHYDLHKKYMRYGYGNALSMFADERIRKNRIVNIYQSGVRSTYQIVTSSGASIVCTDNHKFPTPNGDRTLSELRIGDLLYVKGEYEINQTSHHFTNGIFQSNLPIKGQRGFQNIDNGATVIFNRIKNERTTSCSPCEYCGCEYDKQQRFELHHRDQDETHNDESNLAWCCVSCHKKQHYLMGRTKVFEKGIPTRIEAISSIKVIGDAVVYDIEMESPAHNFISASGLVTSNSHSYSYAGDSLYGAYLKANYPIEFYEVFLQMMEEDGDKDRLALAKIEAEKAFHISFPPYRFGQDNRSIVANKAKNEITQSLKSIKGFGQAISENLYELGQQKYADFLDFLIDAEERSFISKKFEELIKINYFDAFGHNKKLLVFFQEFVKGKSRYGRKLTDKTKSKRIDGLREIWDQLSDDRISVYEQVRAEEELLGHIQSVFPVDKRFVYVQDLNTKFSPRMSAYCLATGKTQSIKIQKRLFDQNPFEPLMIVYCSHFQKKNAVVYKDGEYIENPDEQTWWLDDYQVMGMEQFDEVLTQNH